MKRGDAALTGRATAAHRVGGRGGRITNSPVADVFVVWAKVKNGGPLRGFIVERVRPEPSGQGHTHPWLS